ncbi:MAG: D-alanyl-D-alanine carboxypeptidase family protein [Xanthomonadales bacterium]|nr:D-alanyl-D-alanine carboxypeptidase family protein [Xanthomonadales bacterium]
MTAIPPDGAPERCGTLARREVVAAARAIGVSTDYGSARGLRLVREPAHLACIGLDIHQRRQWLAPAAARAFLRMRSAAADDGIELQVVSAFRSATYQLGIIRRKLERGQAMAEILAVSAAPGYSEHHSGRAVDLTCPGFPALEEAFEHSPAFAWLGKHAEGFGFRLSYPRDNPHGIAYEPWHWCWHARRRPNGSRA